MLGRVELRLEYNKDNIDKVLRYAEEASREMIALALANDTTIMKIARSGKSYWLVVGDFITLTTYQLEYLYRLPGIEYVTKLTLDIARD